MNIKPYSMPIFPGLICMVMAAAEMAQAENPADAIKEVQAGTRQVAQAAWWGFDKEDSTKALQAAINSGAKKLVIGDMGSPWVVDTIQLASDQEIVFEKGVVVQAKRGAFKGKTDALFTAKLKSNITRYGVSAWTNHQRRSWRISTSTCAGSRLFWRRTARPC